jgi:hypothetical protein
MCGKKIFAGAIYEPLPREKKFADARSIAEKNCLETTPQSKRFLIGESALPLTPPALPVGQVFQPYMTG